MDNNFKNNLAASFQKTIIKILKKKTKVAIDEFKKISNNKFNHFVVAGGVAVNKDIRKNLKLIAEQSGLKILFSDPKICGDNAAMIAWAGINRYKKRLLNDLSVPPKSRWQLDKKGSFYERTWIKIVNELLAPKVRTGCLVHRSTNAGWCERCNLGRC